VSTARAAWALGLVLAGLLGGATGARADATYALSYTAASALPRYELSYTERPLAVTFAPPPILTLSWLTPYGAVPLTGCSTQALARVVHDPAAATQSTVGGFASVLGVVPLVVETVVAVARRGPPLQRVAPRDVFRCHGSVGLEWFTRFLLAPERTGGTRLPRRLVGR